MDEEEDVAADEVLRLVPQQGPTRRRHVQARPVPRDPGDHVRRVLGEEPVAGFALAERLERALLLDAVLLLLQRLPDGRPEAGQSILEEVVGRPAPHGLDGRLLLDGPADDEEGDVQALLLHEVERLQSVEPRQRVVGEDDVDLRAEVGDELLPVVYDVQACVIARLGQFEFDERGVVRVVFQQENAQRNGGVGDRQGLRQ